MKCDRASRLLTTDAWPNATERCPHSTGCGLGVTVPGSRIELWLIERSDRTGADVSRGLTVVTDGMVVEF